MCKITKEKVSCICKMTCPKIHQGMIPYDFARGIIPDKKTVWKTYCWFGTRSGLKSYMDNNDYITGPMKIKKSQNGILKLASNMLFIFYILLMFAENFFLEGSTQFKIIFWNPQLCSVVPFSLQAFPSAEITYRVSQLFHHFYSKRILTKEGDYLKSMWD